MSHGFLRLRVGRAPSESRVPSQSWLERPARRHSLVGYDVRDSEGLMLAGTKKKDGDMSLLGCACGRASVLPRIGYTKLLR